ncbi:MAG TPA: site-2 protease family protein [Actinomycetes bacterium]|jgi:Zn-dependent protease
MRESVRLGRIAGIRVGVNWSIVVVFWLICWSLAAAVLPQQVPGATTAAYWAAGVATAVAFFASLLAHELGHAVVARRTGLPVEGITLWLLGGVAKLEGEAADPWAELRIAAVGPLISLVLAAAAASVAAVAGPPRLLVASVAWLARVNLLLAVFNLLPAAPLDGGRLLRGLLWWRTKDRLRSAVAAARMGRLLGALLVGLGFGELVVGAGIGGLWLALLGWFLLSAARAEETSARLRQTLGAVRVDQVMTADPVVGPSWLTVSAFLEDDALRHRCPAFPLRGVDGTLVGLVTLARLTTVPARQRPTTRVDSVMCPLAHVPTATPEEPLVDLLARLGSGCGGGWALVVQDGQLLGMVSPAAIARALQHATVASPAAGLGQVTADNRDRVLPR